VNRLDGTRNALHGSDSPTSAQREISFFFGSKYGVNTACYNDTTCCIIKPHAVAEGKRDKLMNIASYFILLYRKSRTHYQCYSYCRISSFCHWNSKSIISI